jgi:TRAP-type uncharacterized transport system fused permease subunit
MALVGMSAFECFAQGWCLTRNRWYEIPFLIGAAFILLHPGAVASLLNVDMALKYYFFSLGLAVYGLVIVVPENEIEVGRALERYFKRPFLFVVFLGPRMKGGGKALKHPLGRQEFIGRMKFLEFIQVFKDFLCDGVNHIIGNP